jgi:hypothetical protein
VNNSEDAAVARARATRDEAWATIAAQELTGELVDYGPGYSAMFILAQAISRWHECLAKS